MEALNTTRRAFQPILERMPNGTSEALIAAGPVAGSVAAAWQSSIGVVQAGSLFSTVQSVAMAGNAYLIGGGAGAIAPIARAGGWLWRR
ncbi:hypothetical protein H072_315 [Dactylellina haptotyla CBS 200.50]|uniref:Uncharacterized protein n=1 Tax=Dactylellina haptotyla (strain CBS 200.50) TaxID=1284197 RepID=S8CDB7_DACHA|nr:hypothetical protein H072_315 [Dactylellina haptotyla CBS 200.50]